MSKTILVTGATGNVGREVIHFLRERGAEVRAAVISEEEAARLPLGVPWVLFDFGDQSTYPAAFEDVDKMFLMRPPQISDIDTYIKPAIEYAGRAGVTQIVFLSLLGAEKNPVVPHYKVEQILLAGDTPYTLLRCGFFMQNLSTTHAADIREHDDLFIPAGKGKTAFIDARDIGEVAAVTLTEQGHNNKAYPLTGSEAFDYYEVADMMTPILGRRISYSSPSPVRFAYREWRQGTPLAFVGVMTAIYMTTRFGMADSITQDVPQLLGRAPRTLEQFIIDHNEVWQPQTAESHLI
jgi:uncharacterized protein YbjT (DUF2867 family)